MGGGISVLAALEIKTILKPKIPVELITFGGPRVGNQAFVDYFHE